MPPSNEWDTPSLKGSGQETCACPLCSTRFDECLEALERAIPALRDLIEMATHFGEPLGFQLPNRLAADPLASDEACVRERAQVFRDGLTSDRRAIGEAHDRLRTRFAQPHDDAQASFIAERRKERRRLDEPCRLGL